MACLMMERHGVEVAGVPEKRKLGVCGHRVLHAGWEKVGEERLSVGWVMCSVQAVSHSLEFVIGKDVSQICGQCYLSDELVAWACAAVRWKILWDFEVHLSQGLQWSKHLSQG